MLLRVLGKYKVRTHSLSDPFAFHEAMVNETAVIRQLQKRKTPEAITRSIHVVSKPNHLCKRGTSAKQNLHSFWQTIESL